MPTYQSVVLLLKQQAQTTMYFIHYIHINEKISIAPENIKQTHSDCTGLPQSDNGKYKYLGEPKKQVY